MNQEYCKSVSAWLSQNPIRLKVVAGNVAKSQLAYALNITPDGLRHRIISLCKSNSELGREYQEKSKKTELPVHLAEMIIRVMYDNNPNVTIDFLPLTE